MELLGLEPRSLNSRPLSYSSPTLFQKTRCVMGSDRTEDCMDDADDLLWQFLCS